MVKTMGAIFRGWTDGERTDRGEERREDGALELAKPILYTLYFSQRHLSL